MVRVCSVVSRAPFVSHVPLQNFPLYLLLIWPLIPLSCYVLWCCEPGFKGLGFLGFRDLFWGFAIQNAFEGMAFCVDVEQGDGRRVQVPLKPDGASIPLTIKNRNEFVNLYAKYLLVDSVKSQVCCAHTRN